MIKQEKGDLLIYDTA